MKKVYNNILYGVHCFLIFGVLITKVRYDILKRKLYRKKLNIIRF